MTLPYQPVGYAPPCAAGLKVAAILSIVAGGWTWALLVGMEKRFYADLIEVENGTYPGFAVILASTVSSVISTLIFGAFLIGLGIAMWRGKRAVRVLAMVISGWVLLSGFQSIPSMISVVTRSIPQVGINVESLLQAYVLEVVRLFFAAVMFFYFKSERMKETLNHYDPGLSWVERFPPVVFGAMFVSAATCVHTLISAGGYGLLWRLGGGSGAVVLMLLAVFHAALLAAGAFACLRKPSIGWRLFIAALLVSFAREAATTLLLSNVFQPMMDHWKATGVTIEPWTWDTHLPSTLYGLALLWVLRNWSSEFAGASAHPPTDKVAVPQ